MVETKNNAYSDPSTAPTLALETVPTGKVPNQDDYVYDGLGRVVYDESENNATTTPTVYTTTTVYNGDSTTVIPPTGGVEKTTVTDPLGRTSEVEEYSTDPTLTTPSNVNTGTFYLTGGTPVTTNTGYGFDTTSTDATYGDSYTTTTDAKGDVWTSYTDLAGNVVEKKDPTAGTSTMTYDADGNLDQTEDARGDPVSYSYDQLGRKTGEYAAAFTGQQNYSTTSPGNQTAAWVYDNSNGAVTSMSDPIGQLTTETSYSGVYAYVTQYTGFNVFGEPLGEEITIPESSTTMAPLAKTYTVTHNYGTNTGLLIKDNYSADGSLAAETVVHGYTTALDLPNQLTGAGSTYLSSVSYDAWSRPIITTLGSATYGTAQIADTYDMHSGNLTNQSVTRQTDTPTDVDNTQYFYDAANNITSQIETRLGSSSDTETQCYTYDALDQLTSAWSATDNCATAPTSSSHSRVANTLGNNSAYWDTWTYDNIGNRLTQDQHAIGTATVDALTTNTYSTTQPSTLISTSTTGASTSPTSYSYDLAGNTHTRDTSAGDQTLTWNNNGTLAEDANSTTGTSSSYIYDADGNLLLQLDPTTTTLYLGYEQLTLTNGSGSVATTRYYTLPGGATVVRTGANTDYQFEIANQQGTADLYLDYTCQTPTWRQFDPYGNPRGTAVTWIDNRTVMDKPTDAVTGLTDDGARYLDTAIGRFISLDSFFEADDTLALNGYSYTSDNPVTEDDPSGDMPAGCTGTSCTGTGGGENGAGSDRHGGSKHKKRDSTKGTATSSDETAVSSDSSTDFLSRLNPYWQTHVYEESYEGPLPFDYDGTISIQDVVQDPSILENMSPEEFIARLDQIPEGWKVEVPAQGNHAGLGLVLRQYAAKVTRSGKVVENKTGSLIKWQDNPRHDGSYWRVKDNLTNDGSSGNSEPIPGGETDYSWNGLEQVRENVAELRGQQSVSPNTTEESPCECGNGSSGILDGDGGEGDPDIFGLDL